MRRAARSGWATRSWPKSRLEPASGRSRPVSWRTSVVFPAPLGPSSPKISPSPMSRSMPSLARTAGDAAALRPRPAGYVLTSPRTDHTVPRAVAAEGAAADSVPVLTSNESTRRGRGAYLRGRGRGRGRAGDGDGPCPRGRGRALSGRLAQWGLFGSRGALGNLAGIDLAPEARPDGVAVVLVDLVVLVGKQPEAGRVAQQLTVDAVRDARVLAGELLQQRAVGEPVDPAAGEDPADPPRG